MENVIKISPSNIETIDGAFLNYVEGLNIFCNTINGWEKIPVIWSSAERAYQIKNNKEIRDKNGALIPPIISIERASTAKDPASKGGFFNSLSPNYDRRVIAQLINQEKTANFAGQDTLRATGQINFATSKKNKKVAYRYYSAPLPIYITIEYKIHIITNYQGQMNEALQPFMARKAQNYFIINNEEHRYECFMNQSFDQENPTNLGEEERKYKTTVSVKVLGYIIGEGNNQESSTYDIQENAVEIKLNKENLSTFEEKQEKQVNISQGVKLASSNVAVKKTFIIGDGSTKEIYDIEHGLRTRDMYVQVRENFGTYDTVTVSIGFPDINTLSIDMGAAIGVDSYVVTIIG